MLAIGVASILVPSADITKPNDNSNVISPVEKTIEDIKFDDLKQVNYPTKNITNSFKIPGNTPAKANIFDYSPSKIQPSFVETVIKNLNVKKQNTINSPKDGTIVISGLGQKTLTFYQDHGYFIYTNEKPLTTTLKNFTESDDIDSVRIAAEEQIRTQFNIDLSRYNYNFFAFINLNDPHVEIVNDKAKASGIQFIYQEVIDGIPIYSNYKLYPKNQIAVVIDKEKVIRRLDGKMIPNIKKTDTSLTLKSQAETESAIKNNKAELISTDSILEPNDIINNTNITSAELIYLERDGKLVPVYKLGAQIQTEKQNVSEATYYLNAVRSD